MSVEVGYVINMAYSLICNAEHVLACVHWMVTQYLPDIGRVSNNRI